MNIEVAKEIVRADSDITLRPTYRGRGMFGRHTAAIVFSSYNQLIKAVAVAAMRAGYSDENWVEYGELDLRFDNMGHDLIAY